MTGFKIINLITNILMSLYAFLYCGLVGGFSLLEAFFSSWGGNQEGITESIILLSTSGLMALHGFTILILGIVAFAAWRKKAKPYLICHLICAISGIAIIGGLCLLYSINATGACDVIVMGDHLLRGEVMILIYVALCVLELLLTLLAHVTRKRGGAENGKRQATGV